MTDILHKNLTEADLHETKGASTAAAGSVPVANGSGSTSFQKITTSNIDTSSIRNLNTFVVTVDIEAPNSVFTHYVVVPFAGTLTSVYSVLDVAPNAALTVSMYNSANNLLGSVAFASTDTVPTVKTLSPSTNNTFTAGTTIKIANASAITSAGKLTITMVFTA